MWRAQVIYLREMKAALREDRKTRTLGTVRQL